MLKILFVNGGPLNRGGIETFMMNIYRQIDKSQFSIDFAVGNEKEGAYDSEILEHGDSIFRLPKRSKHPIKYFFALVQLFNKEHYDIVHAQLDAMNGYVLLAAMFTGVKVRISHSHNVAPMTRNVVKRFAQYISKIMIRWTATARWACSDDAGIWLYGQHASYTVVRNAIDLESFSFNGQDRVRLRNTLNVGNALVIGHIGRFDYQKNQEFLIPILEKLVSSHVNVHLVFVGDGHSRKSVEQLVKDKGLQKYVTFVGVQANVQEWYNAFDVFVLPSRFEGLGIVAIEAEANGLPCIVSDRVPRDVSLSSDVAFLSLSSPKLWVEKLKSMNFNRNQMAQKNCRAAGYDLVQEVERIERLYQDEVQKS